MLNVSGLTVIYGRVTAVSAADLEASRGTVVGLIGPNGAGKTSFIDAVSGFVGSTGSIVFNGDQVGGLSAHRRALAGLVRTWQSIELFDDLTVFENLAAAAARTTRWLGRSLEPSEALERVGLGDVLQRLPTELSNGDRKLVGLARALMSDPLVILADEPAAGLDTMESQALGTRLRELVDSGLTVLLVDHDMNLVLNVCDAISVIDFGRIIANGTPNDIRNDDTVIAAYLGAADDEPTHE
ncbi:MAG: ABC transporter ATP-binding protein [Acidimicrobiia bacterium]